MPGGISIVGPGVAAPGSPFPVGVDAAAIADGTSVAVPDVSVDSFPATQVPGGGVLPMRPGDPKDPKEDDPFSMQKLFGELRSMSNDMKSNFAQISVDINTLKGDMVKLKSEVVTTKQYEELESRVHVLETNVVSPENPDVKLLQDQLDRLDPAHRSLSFRSFSGVDLEKRTKMIEDFFSSKLPSFASKIDICHEMKGPYNSRRPGNVTVVSLSSKTQRDAAMQAIRSATHKLFEDTTEIKIGFAQSSRQRRRTWAIHKATEMITADSQTSGTVTQNWRIEGLTGSDKGKRTVTVNNVVAFEQTASESTGRFCGPYAALFLP